MSLRDLEREPTLLARNKITTTKMNHVHRLIIAEVALLNENNDDRL